jgi:hypothetical protein
MTDTDKIVAAILTASMYTGKAIDHATYLQTYEEFLEKMETREKAKKKPPKISDDALARFGQKDHRTR